MYGKELLCLILSAIKSDDLLNNHLATIILITLQESMAQYQMIQLQLLQQELLLYRCLQEFSAFHGSKVYHFTSRRIH
jgi:hypothetical protein